MKRNSEIIGFTVEYQAGGKIFTGKVIDKVRILGRGEDHGKEFDLYMILTDNGRIYKISPAAITRILEV